MMKKVVTFAITVSLWVCLYIAIQGLVFQFVLPLFGVEASFSVEFWPALIGPSLVTLLGGTKEAQFTYYRHATSGILLGLIFLLTSHPLVVATSSAFGALIPIFFIIIIAGVGGIVAPKWLGGVTLIVFNIAILSHDQHLVYTITRLVVLWGGTSLFLLVEHWLRHKIIGDPAAAAAAAAAAASSDSAE